MLFLVIMFVVTKIWMKHPQKYRLHQRGWVARFQSLSRETTRTERLEAKDIKLKGQIEKDRCKENQYRRNGIVWCRLGLELVFSRQNDFQSTRVKSRHTWQPREAKVKKEVSRKYGMTSRDTLPDFPLWRLTTNILIVCLSTQCMGVPTILVWLML